MAEEFPDHYRTLQISEEANTEDVRRAFRTRLLQVHPDKGEAGDAREFSRVLQAFEVLSDPDLRERYDRLLEIQRREDSAASKLPHVTESKRAVDRARSILYLLLNSRVDEALDRLSLLEEDARFFLSEHLENEELVDVSFLLGEVYEKRKQYYSALEWYELALAREQNRRYHRPCYPEVIDRAKRILVHRLSSGLDPHTQLDFLDRAEQLGLSRAERAEVCKRRAQCYFDLDMRAEAARQIREALELAPQLKGLQKLRAAVADYL